MAQSRPESAHFDPTRVVEGSTISRPDCAVLEAAHTAIWVELGRDSACLRYYAAGLKAGGNPIAMIWLHGDVLGPNGRNADRRQSGFGPAEMVALEQGLAARFGLPSVFIGRPGAYGSAGKHHAMRGRLVEARLIEAALDGLKARYGMGALALGGHSGGATLVAEMLARRDDLRCAVIASGAASYRAYLEARGLIRPGEALTRFDPSASPDRVPVDRARRIFVIGDPRETNVPFAAQRQYFEGLVSRGHAAWLVPLERATDARHHDLVDFGETANGLCAAGADTEAILTTLRAMPDQPARLTN